MEHEVFVQSNGEMFSAWDVQFTNVEQYRESAPCTYHEPDGSVRKGKVYFTLESAEVSFCASKGSVQTGQQGQLSSMDDRFYDVTISALTQDQDYLRVVGRATRKGSFEKDR
jgi:hypothetical protein